MSLTFERPGLYSYSCPPFLLAKPSRSAPRPARRNGVQLTHFDLKLCINDKAATVLQMCLVSQKKSPNYPKIPESVKLIWGNTVTVIDRLSSRDLVQ